MMPGVIVLERTIWRAPLGLRFRDLARGSTINDGLQVQAWQAGSSSPRFTAGRSPLSGVYGFTSLPGLRAYEVGDQEAAAFCSSPPEGGVPNFVVSVEDSHERFLPQTLLLCLPKEKLIEVPLFSAPARAGWPGFGVVRGEVWDNVGDQPAGWAFITASSGPGSVYTTVADERGMFVLFLPYAGSLPALVGSPPHGELGVDQASWPLELKVYYEPGKLERLAGLRAPETRSILQQAQAQVLDTLSTQAASITRRIYLGSELVAATSGKPRLLVVPA